MSFSKIRIQKSNRGIGIWQRCGQGYLSDLSFKDIDIQTQFMPMPQFWGSGDPLVVTSIPTDAASLKSGLRCVRMLSSSVLCVSFVIVRLKR